jgi:hypothetical protein
MGRWSLSSARHRQDADRAGSNGISLSLVLTRPFFPVGKRSLMFAVPIYVAAALAEIAGCFAFWAWFRLDKSILWLPAWSPSHFSGGC